MSKVRPKKGSKPDVGPTEPVVLASGTNDRDFELPTQISTRNSSIDTSSSSTSLSTNSTTSFQGHTHDQFKMFKNAPFRSDGGFGAMNPLYNDSDDTSMPPDLPSPIKPTIATSYSLPTMSSMTSTMSGLMSPKVATTTVCSSVTSISPHESLTNSVTSNVAQVTPPNTPSSPVREPSPRRTKSEVYKIPNSNPLSPDLATPPNTPFTQPSSPETMDPRDQLSYPRTSIASDEVLSPTNPAILNKGQLYNILGYPVDLPDTRPARRLSIQISPEDTETKLFPFAKYPKPYVIDSLSDNEKFIRDLVNLGNGIYDGDIETKNEIQDSPVKSDQWEKLEDREQIVTACWNHNLDRPKVEDQKQRQGDDESEEKNKTRQEQDSTQKRPAEEQNGTAKSNARSKPNAEVKYKSAPDPIQRDRKSKQTKVAIVESKKTQEPNVNLYENKRDSLYSHLKIPMIDDEVDGRKADLPGTNGFNGSTSSQSGDIDCFGSEAAELAEQLADVTSEAGRLIAKELREGINYLTQPEDTLEFTWIDAMTGVISIGAFYFDLVSDSLVAYYMFDDPNAKYWFRVTLMLIILPLLLANGFSLYWYWFDERVCEPQGACFKHPRVANYVWVLRILGHVLLQASPLRQLDIIYYGTKSTSETVLREALVDEVMEAALVTQPEDDPATPVDKKRRGSRRVSFRPEAQQLNDPTAPLTRPASACSRSTGGVCARGGYVALWIHAERDAANVDLLLSLVQDAPLLILHVYILAHTLPAQVEQGQLSQTIIMQILSVAISLLTLAWSVASFVRAIRLAEPTLCNLSMLDLLLLTLAHFCSIAGQVMSFALFASKLLVAFCVVGTVHWLTMTTWVLVQLLCFPRTTCTRAMFAHDKTVGPCNRLDDVVYSSTMGLIFLFTFIDTGGFAPKTQSLLYHVFRLLEEAILLAFWFVWVNGTDWYHWLPLVLVPVLFCLNLFFDSLFIANTKPVECIAIECAPESL